MSSFWSGHCELFLLVFFVVVVVVAFFWYESWSVRAHRCHECFLKTGAASRAHFLKPAALSASEWARRDGQ